jgi:hypothetical protein
MGECRVGATRLARTRSLHVFCPTADRSKHDDAVSGRRSIPSQICQGDGVASPAPPPSHALAVLWGDPNCEVAQPLMEACTTVGLVLPLLDIAEDSEQFPRMRVYRIFPSSIPYDRLLKWIGDCHDNHHGFCKMQDPTFSGPLNLIDCTTSEIVPNRGRWDYCTLSYV